MATASISQINRYGDKDEEIGVPITFDSGRTYNDIITDISNSSAEFLSKNYLLHEKAWYEESSKKLAEGRKRWEDEIKVMRDQFFSLAPHQLQKERAAALMDTYTFDQLQTQHVRAPNGQLYFHIKFEVREFDIHKLKVTVKGARITVRAIQSTSNSNNASDNKSNGFRELVRGVNLPSNAMVNDTITATITKDNILLVMVPLKGAGLGSEHKCVPPTISSSFESPKVMSASKSGEKLVRLQVFLGSYYKPDEISVMVGEHSVKVYAKHEDKKGSSSCFREFQREWDLPEEVLSNMACASLTPGGNLIVEAPMQTENKPKTQGERTSVSVTYSEEEQEEGN